MHKNIREKDQKTKSVGMHVIKNSLVKISTHGIVFFPGRPANCYASQGDIHKPVEGEGDFAK